MKNTILRTAVSFALIGIGLTGCGRKGGTPPATQSVLTAWQQGDKPAAVRCFVEADWNARPLFAPGSTLSLTEEQFMSLTSSDRDAKMKDVLAQVNAMRELANTVMQAGRDAAGKKDVVQARKYFASVKEYGVALNSSDTLALVKIIGKAIKGMADVELSKLSP